MEPLSDLWRRLPQQLPADVLLFLRLDQLSLHWLSRPVLVILVDTSVTRRVTSYQNVTGGHWTRIEGVVVGYVKD